MTGNLLIDTLISVAAIAVMVGFARLLFPAPTILVTEATARARLALDEPDFEPRAWLIDKKGRAALVEGADAGFAIIKALGLDLVIRRFPAEAPRTSYHNEEITLKFDDLTMPRAVISNDSAKAWALKLSKNDIEKV